MSNGSWQARLAALDRRLLAGVLGAALLFVAIECWLMVLRPPWIEWRALAALRSTAQAPTETASTPAEIERLTQSVAGVEQQTQAALVAPRSDDDTVLFLIGALDRLGSRHGVALGGVRPASRGIVQGFQATSFEIEAQGTYLALTDWLNDSRAAIAPLVPTEFTLNLAGEDSRLALKMKVTAYATAAGAQGSP